jgi:hypothetical protein
MLIRNLLLWGLLILLIVVIPQGGNGAGRGVLLLLDLLRVIAMQGQTQSFLDRIILFSKIYKVFEISIVLVSRHVGRPAVFQNC